MNNKEKILQALIESFNNNKGEESIGVTSTELAEKLDMRRNVVSLHLNELFREGLVKKTNTRPVYFNAVNKDKSLHIVQEEVDTFKELIGSKGSLKVQVDQCKVAASYPDNGLPVLLTGESGVGKSYMAQLICEYARSNGYIDEDSPFVVFNCAEYANNKELLSAKLFGFQKGAFTGANTDMIGLIEEADNGYLFLDEVHRLSPEGQEKLFLLMDKGVFNRLGETGELRKANIRFVFATTEQPENVLLETFMRRIPLQIKIPSFSDRPLKEKLQLIYRFYKEEALKTGYDIQVSKVVLNALITNKLNGNIGKLMNLIKYSSAYAYKESISAKKDKIYVRLNDLPYDFINYDANDQKSNLKDMYISLKEDYEGLEEVINDKNAINERIIRLAEITEENENNFESKELIFKEAAEVLNEITDEIIFNKDEFDFEIFPLEILERTVVDGLKFLENHYGLKYYGNTSDVISKSLSYFMHNAYDASKKEKKLLLKAEEILRKTLPRYYLITNKLISIIELNIDYKFDVREMIFFIYFLYSINSKNEPAINSIIIAHGYSTASSIASVANKLVGEFIFEAFDMPLDVSSEEISKEIKKYLETADTSKGLIALVDMGSLENLHESLRDVVKNDIAVINNITTQIALEVGFKINQGSTIREIVESVDKWNKIKCQYVRYSNNKKNVILTTCISGMGTAIKIRDLMRECIDDTGIEIMAYDFNKLKNNNVEDEIFKEFNVLLVVGTSKLSISGIPYINMEELVSGEGQRILNIVLKNKLKNKTIEDINTNIIKKFSIENILNRLTILNPNKIIDQVERAISDIEIGIRKQFSNNLKISLLIHISCLIERLIVRDYIDIMQGHEEFEVLHEDFINLIKAAFSEITKIYKVDMPIGEIQMIYEIINNM